MMRSLRSRLLLGALMATLVVFVAAAAVLYWLLRAAWLREFDAAMDARAQAVIALVEYDRAGLKMDMEEGLSPEFQMASHASYFLITDGQSTLRSPSLGEGNWLNDGYDQHAFISLPSGRVGRVVQLSFMPRVDEAGSVDPSRAVIRVAHDATELSERLLQLACGIGAVFLLAILVAATAMAWAVGRGLRPLAELADHIHALGATNLSERVSEEHSPTEMRVVVRRLNELLARVEAGVRREREFTADVAHELRTPLGGMITAMEVCLSRPRGPRDYEQTLGSCLHACSSMRGMVENLLTLARAEAQQIRPACEAVDMPCLLRELWHAFAQQAGERELRIEWLLHQPLMVRTDPGLLSTIVRNLFDNAVAYCDRGGMIRIETAADGSIAILRVSNTGSQVAQEDVFHVFERFWRGDAARIVAGHCGLGLALCERIVGLLGGSIAVHSALDGLFTIEIRLPGIE